MWWLRNTRLRFSLFSSIFQKRSKPVLNGLGHVPTSPPGASCVFLRKNVFEKVWENPKTFLKSLFRAIWPSPERCTRQREAICRSDFVKTAKSPNPWYHAHVTNVPKCGLGLRKWLFHTYTCANDCARPRLDGLLRRSIRRVWKIKEFWKLSL